MGFKTASQQRTTVQTAGSSAAAVEKSADGSGYTISSQAITSSTVFKQLTAIPGTVSSATVVSGGSAGISITTILATDSNYNPLTPPRSTVNTSGGYVSIIGTGFNSQNKLYIQGNLVTSTTYVSSGQINARVPGYVATYPATAQIYVVNTATNSAGILITGFQYGIQPYWTIGTSLTGSTPTVNVNLSALSDTTLTYALYSGTIPAGLSLNTSTGVLSGSISTGTSTTFTILATNVEGETNTQTFTITILSADPYFYETSLLLNGETNTNTYIQDISTNNFALTPIGAATSNRFNPLWGNGYYGNSFSSSYLSYTQPAAFTGDFTIEGWVNPSALTTYNMIWASSSPNHYFCLLWGATSSVFGLNAYNGSVSVGSSSNVTAINQWHHIAFVRISGVLYFYIDGIQTGSAGFTGTIGSSGTATIGYSTNYSSTNYFNGSLSNFRIVNGVGVYTGNFTVPTSPLTITQSSGTNITAITSGQTQLLTAQNNSFVDNSSNASALTPNGTVKVVPNQPFGAVPSGVQNYGSGLLDGSSGYMTSVTSGNAAFTFGTGDFSMEAWIYSTSYAANYQSIVNVTPASGYTVYIETSGNQARFLDFNNPSSNFVFAGGTLNNGTWNHLVITRQSGTIRGFVNGQLVGTASGITYNYNATSYANIGSTSFGANLNISNIRIIKGGVPTLYSTSNTTNGTQIFTPPTSAFTGSESLTGGSVSLILLQNKQNQNNNVFYDDSTNNYTLTRTGTPTQGTFSPFSQAGWSYYFAGGSNWVSANSSPISTTNSTFTVEGWIYMTAVPVGTTPCVIGDMTPGGNSNSWSFGPMGSSPVVSFYWYDGAGKTVSGNTVMSLNTWYHIAISINANAISMYVNGVQQTLTGTTTLTNRAGSVGYIGLGEWTSAVSAYYIGYASSLRISNIALYSSSFTPPTTTFTTSSNTVFLTAQSNRFVDLSTNNYTLTPTGASVQAFSPFPPSATYSVATNGGSMYFGSSSDNVGQASTTAWVFGGDFTIEGWFYFLPAGAGTFRYVVNTSGGNVYLNTDNTLHYVFQSVTDFASSQVVNAGQWVHLVVCRNGGTYRFFVNGNMTISTGSSSSIPATAGINVGTSAFYAYGVKITNGVSLYNSSFAIPTTITTGTSTNSLILLATNSGIQDATGKNNLITFGTTKTQSNTVKYGTGAMYFDGSSYISSPAVNGYGTGDFGTGDFTVEFWMNNSMSSGNFIPVLGTQDISGNTTAGMWRVSIRGNATSGILFNYTNGSAFTDVTFTTTSYNDGTWHHVAVTRASGSVRAFVDGTQVGTTQSITQNLTSGQKTYIGYQPQDGVYYTGYLDDIRITRGYARYTANFTPPISGSLTQ